MKLESNNLKCAECGKIFVKSEENKPFLPFCSKRCKMIDLGQWFAEKYVVPDNEPVPTKKSDLKEEE